MTKKQESNSGPTVIVALAVAAVVLVLAVLALVHYFVPATFGEPSGPGVYGDMFGAANALFSGLALAGVVLAIVLQSRELSLQRQELEATRRELAGQKDQLALQQKTLSRQQFENTFFHHLELLNSIVESMDFNHGKERRPSTGRDCFGVFLNLVRRDAQRVRGSARSGDVVVDMRTAYLDFYRQKNTEVGHYFRTLYNTVRYVHDSDVSDKLTYMRLVRAQLSSDELVLLMLNCLCPAGKGFRPLIEKYGLFKHIPENILGLDLEESLELLKNYSDSAYGK